MADLRQAARPILRGTGLGAVLGLLPGNGAVLGPFASYTLEKKLAADPQPVRLGSVRRPRSRRPWCARNPCGRDHPARRAIIAKAGDFRAFDPAEGGPEAVDRVIDAVGFVATRAAASARSARSGICSVSATHR